MKKHEQWEELLRQSPFMQPRFNECMKKEIIRKYKEKPISKFYRYRFRAIIAIMIICVGTLFINDSEAIFTKRNDERAPRMSFQTEAVRTEYKVNGKALFQVFPDPALIAGAQYGYMIHFTQPFETFSGKSISIKAYHLGVGKQVTVVAPVKITEPSPGYESLDRFVTRFGLPFGGTWRFEVNLNERFYGDFVLKIKEPASWTESGTFNLPYEGVDGLSHKYVLMGEEGKVGFLIGPYQNDNGELLDKQPIIAGKGNKYMWFFWGTKEELTGGLSIMALKEGTNREIDMFRTPTGPWNTKDSRTPTSMVFPEEGMWRVNAYIGNRLFGSITVQVQPQN